MLFPQFKVRSRFLSKLLNLFLLILISLGVIYGCGPSNPSEAPFGSEITLTLAPEGINLCGNGIEPVLVRAVVTGPDGLPISDVIVSFDLSFAGENSLVVDTDGNGLADARMLQWVDNSKCSPKECLNTPIEEWYAAGAFQDSPMQVLTDDFGVAEAVILTAGFTNIFEDTGQILCAETTISAFSGTATATQDFDYNTDCEIVIIDESGEEITIDCGV